MNRKGHCPDYDAAEKHNFSYWTCELENNKNKMNMKTNILLFIAALIMCGSCQWNKYNDSLDTTETKKTYIQTNNSQQNYPESENSDSTYIYYSNFNESKLNSIRVDSTLCNIFIEGKLIINGGYYTDISDTYVTVKKITVNIRIDNGEKIAYYPEVNTTVAEPEYVYEWENMPEGINYNRKQITIEPLVISYKENFYAEVTVDYALRTKDTKLAAECSIDHYSNTVTYQSMHNNIIRKNILVPLELTTIEISATVSDYE